MIAPTWKPTAGQATPAAPGLAVAVSAKPPAKNRKGRRAAKSVKTSAQRSKNLGPKDRWAKR